MYKNATKFNIILQIIPSDCLLARSLAESHSAVSDKKGNLELINSIIIRFLRVETKSIFSSSS